MIIKLATLLPIYKKNLANSVLRGHPHITSSLLRGVGVHKMMMVDDVREGGLSK